MDDGTNILLQRKRMNTAFFMGITIIWGYYQEGIQRSGCKSISKAIALKTPTKKKKITENSTSSVLPIDLH